MQKPPQKQERWFRRLRSIVLTMRTTASQGLHGVGGSTDTSLGLVVITEAATKGSDYAAWVLGKAFFKGTSGLSKDPARARYWLKKIADGECAHKHLNNKAKATAAEWLRALDD